MIRDKAEKKKQLVAEIIRSKGFKTMACSAVGLNPRTFRQWMAEDAEFRAAIDDAVTFSREYRDDVAEQKLFSLVESGDTTATIFYAKTRLKDRGYSERYQLQPVPPPQAQPEAATAAALPAEAEAPRPDPKMQRRIAQKKSYIVRLLKKQGRYSAEMSMQAGLVAQLLVRTEELARQVFDARHVPVRTELSREGNTRETVSPTEKLYLDFLGQSQRALRALGMNTDSRARPPEGDNLGELLSEFRE